MFQELTRKPCSTYPVRNGSRRRIFCFHAHMHIIPRFANEPMAGKGIELWQHLQTLTQKFERDGFYRMDESNREFAQGIMRGTVGFKIRIQRCEGKWKLSQNHSRERRERVIEALDKISSDNAKNIAKLMKSTLLSEGRKNRDE